MNQHNSTSISLSPSAAGLFTLSLRLVTGWTYFSAFWRRLVLENKLDPDQAGYIGEKFNHFLPNALLIKPMIEYLVSNGEALWWFMLAFTIVEGLVGFLFIAGLFTRLMSLAIVGLALGILLSAGWLGTTCLDEWQIGILGLASGFTIFLTGSGKQSLDHLLFKKGWRITKRKFFPWIGSGALPVSAKKLTRIGVTGAVLITAISLFTNQYFHGGVWGQLHNLSVRPKVEISHAGIENGRLSFTIFRVEGADVYGSFLIKIAVKDERGNLLLEKNAEALSRINASDIENAYTAKIKPGKHSLVIPLGAKARLSFMEETLQQLPKGLYTLELTDISGIVWKEIISL